MHLPLKIYAKAKINLFLHIVGREGKYHGLQSLISFADIADSLSFSKSKNLNLNITGEFAAGLLENKKANLIYQAVNLLVKKYNISSKVNISLVKNLPIAAGIGGGSADAAAALLGLNKFYNLNISLEEIKSLGKNIGADVPACLESKNIFIEGIGDKIKPVNIGFELYIVLVNPLVETPTNKVFNQFDDSFSKRIKLEKSWNNYADFIGFLKTCRNDLKNAAIKISPIVANVLSSLEKTNPDIYNMSGSGATCFAIYKNKKKAFLAEKYLKNKYNNWWVVATKI